MSLQRASLQKGRQAESRREAAASRIAKNLRRQMGQGHIEGWGGRTPQSLGNDPSARHRDTNAAAAAARHAAWSGSARGSRRRGERQIRLQLLPPPDERRGRGRPRRRPGLARRPPPAMARGKGGERGRPGGADEGLIAMTMHAAN
ncbi:uncharacterized protein [Triticum aestivum]|uniref:uncharacterized protein isoform X2 n=1 Tax=Triticum aestivum TaxID=4565 RepID=UPI001D0284DC|nr:uncharacterized protein LOC123102452 isoform X2 [Triticum aestivum]